MNEIIVSAPGKIILHGEHSVVYGRSAIACCLNIRTYLTLRQTNLNTVSLVLPDVGIRHSWSLDEIKKIEFKQNCEMSSPKPPTEEQLKQVKDFLCLGNDGIEIKDVATVIFLYIYLSVCQHSDLSSVEIEVKSELPIGAGLGSSAGFSVCLSTALLMMAGIVSRPTEENVWKDQDLDLINKWAFIGETLTHGKPSGIDNSIATYGKAIKFKSGKINKLEKIPNLRVLVINTKIPRSTKDLVAGVRKKYEQYEDIVKPVLDSMETIVTKSEDILSKIFNSDGDLISCYKILQDLIDMNQDLLRFLGVSHSSLDTVCNICKQFRLHCKLTGAGGGGCAFCLISPETTEEVLNSVQTQLRNNNIDCWETNVGGNGVMLHCKNSFNRKVMPEFKGSCSNTMS